MINNVLTDILGEVSLRQACNSELKIMNVEEKIVNCFIMSSFPRYPYIVTSVHLSKFASSSLNLK